MRVKGVCFSTSARAIVLPTRRSSDSYLDHPVPLEEGFTMPMLGNTKVDNRMMELLRILESSGDVTLSGHDQNRVKILAKDGRSCLLPNRVPNGGSDIHEITRQLRNIGLDIDLMTRKATYTDSAGHSHPIITDDDSIFVATSEATFGFPMTSGTIYLMRQLLESLKADLATHVETKAAAAGGAKEWQLIAEEAEAKLTQSRKERDSAVADVVRQRDDARKRAEDAERALADVRRSLSGLQALFSSPSPNGQEAAK